MMLSSRTGAEPFMSTLLSEQALCPHGVGADGSAGLLVPTGNDPKFVNDIKHVSRGWAGFLGLLGTEMRLLWSIKVTDDSVGTEG